jgi:hypothetical protein
MLAFMTKEGPVTLVNTCSDEEEELLAPLPRPGVVPPAVPPQRKSPPLPPRPAVRSTEWISGLVVLVWVWSWILACARMRL